jgi:hypothetical protein
MTLCPSRASAKRFAWKIPFQKNHPLMLFLVVKGSIAVPLVPFTNSSGDEDFVNFLGCAAAKDEAVVEGLKGLTSGFQEIFPSLELSAKERALGVFMQGYWKEIAFVDERGLWVVKDHAEELMRNYVLFQTLEKKILSEEGGNEKVGWYIVVNSQDDRTLHMVESSAILKTSGRSCFIGRIGFDWRTDGQILVLPSTHKPPGFNNIEERFVKLNRLFKCSVLIENPKLLFQNLPHPDVCPASSGPLLWWNSALD